VSHPWYDKLRFRSADKDERCKYPLEPIEVESEDEDGTITEYPEEHDPANLVWDGENIMSYFSGVELSVLEKGASEWTNTFPDGLQMEVNPNSELQQYLIGLNEIDRAGPSLLDKDTMFYSLTDWDRNFSPSCIWRATAEGAYPNKVWTEDEAPVVCVTKNDLKDGAPYAIDASAFYDADESPWLVFGSHFSGIYIVELDNTGKMKDAERFFYSDNEDLFTQLARGEELEETDEIGVEVSGIEASYIYYHDGFYYLFVNWGACCRGIDSTYNIRVGRSEEVDGVYYDKDDEDMNEDEGGTILIDDVSPSNDRIIGPGHAGIIENDGQYWFSFHFYDAENDGVGTLGVYELTWDENEDGWPSVDLTVPMPLNI